MCIICKCQYIYFTIVWIIIWKYNKIILNYHSYIDYKYLDNFVIIFMWQFF